MPGIRTYVDASILIAALKGTEDVSEIAMDLLEDSKREFVVSEYLRLETFPHYIHDESENEVAFLEEFFRAAIVCTQPSMELMARAYKMAIAHRLTALDALHLGAAELAQADEIVTRDTDWLRASGTLPVKYFGP